MNKGVEVARGKTKVLYERDGDSDVLVVTQLDNRAMPLVRYGTKDLAVAVMASGEFVLR